jgi:hypothetical protein
LRLPAGSSPLAWLRSRAEPQEEPLIQHRRVPEQDGTLASRSIPVRREGEVVREVPSLVSGCGTRVDATQAGHVRGELRQGRRGRAGDHQERRRLLHLPGRRGSLVLGRRRACATRGPGNRCGGRIDGGVEAASPSAGSGMLSGLLGSGQSGGGLGGQEPPRRVGVPALPTTDGRDPAASSPGLADACERGRRPACAAPAARWQPTRWEVSRAGTPVIGRLRGPPSFVLRSPTPSLQGRGSNRWC